MRDFAGGVMSSVMLVRPLAEIAAIMALARLFWVLGDYYRSRR